MRALWHIWQTALGEWGGAIRSRRALVLLVLEMLIGERRWKKTLF
jgi:hypothetical protein